MNLNDTNRVMVSLPLTMIVQYCVYYVYYILDLFTASVSGCILIFVV